MIMGSNYIEDVVKIYFARLFPFKELYQWLSYGNESIFAHREFALNFQGERFLRHQAYSNMDELKRFIRKEKPIKLDVGAVYNVSPLAHIKELYFYPVQKELIFDLDMTDYDEIRACCSSAKICHKCWKFMNIAMQILDSALREDFGFDNILWTFSGRRGVHCWVSDERARFLKHDARFAVATYLQVVTGGEFKKKKVEIKHTLHPSIKRALAIIEPVFVKVCIEEQDMLGTESRVLRFLGILDEELRYGMRKMLAQYSTSLTRWEAFVNFYQEQIELGSEKWCKTPFLIQEIMIQYAYPRLDIQVTLGTSHLLKAPFCVHPKTGKIGVPIDSENFDQFDPFKVPTIEQLMEEIDLFDARAKKQGMSNEELKKIADIEKTSLNKYFCTFLSFLKAVEKKSLEQDSDVEMEF